MPQTLTGWILFAAIMASAMGTAATATKLIMMLRGRMAFDRRDTVTAPQPRLRLTARTTLKVLKFSS